MLSLLACTPSLLLPLSPLLVAFITISDGLFLKSHLVRVSDTVTLVGEANESC